MRKLSVSYVLFFILLVSGVRAQNIAINATGALPNAKAILDIADTSKGLLIPRLTTTQRNNIAAPPLGLQIFNTTTETFDIYRSGGWESALTAPAHNLVQVYSTTDLPAAAGGVITLDGTKMYIFHGIINIGSDYIDLNGANLRGVDPSRDGVMSSVSGAILRSTDQSVFIENFTVIPLSSATKAYDFSDATGTKFCNLFSGCSVIEVGIPSAGVGQISGFKATTLAQNYWSCTDGIKFTGTVGKICVAYTFITGIANGSGIEFLSGLTVNDIDLSNNYFIYTGQTGVTLNAGATVDRGRMTTNMLRGVSTALSGFDSYTLGWSMQQNAGIPDSRSYGFLYMNNNTSATSLPVVGTYYKIAGTTSLSKAQRFTAGNNKFTYTGKEDITARIVAIVGGKSPANSADFTIAIAKNGTVIPYPNSSIGSMVNNQGFQIFLETEIDLSTNDYIEIYILSANSNASAVTISDMQFRVSD